MAAIPSQCLRPYAFSLQRRLHAFCIYTAHSHQMQQLPSNRYGLRCPVKCQNNCWAQWWVEKVSFKRYRLYCNPMCVTELRQENISKLTNHRIVCLSLKESWLCWTKSAVCNAKVTTNGRWQLHWLKTSTLMCRHENVTNLCRWWHGLLMLRRTSNDSAVLKTVIRRPPKTAACLSLDVCLNYRLQLLQLLGPRRIVGLLLHSMCWGVCCHYFNVLLNVCITATIIVV